MSWTIDDGVVRRPRSVLREVEEEPVESAARYVDTEEWIRVRTRPAAGAGPVSGGEGGCDGSAHGG